ncbi:uncharacterized protein [Diabrotica undecimpunctata]|uniref:uncharacterized protein n=1 Tax=Diabrotica undecimpunctata TaxID=50387 RepID=UPI003B63B9EC
MDANTNVYRVGLGGKKWWWPIFTWLLDTSIQNSWIIYRKHHPGAPQLNFRRKIAQVYLKRFQNLPKAAGRPATYSPESRIAVDIRYDHSDHYVEYVPNHNRRRCAGSHAQSSAVRTQCSKCNVGLCIQCFSDFHKQN